MQKFKKNDAASFDAIAANYDVDFSTTLIGRLQRKRVWNFLLQKFEGQKRLNILELNGGTGEDAIWLAQHLDAKIWLTDQSSKMLEIAQKKVDENNLTTKIHIQICNIQNVAQQFKNQQFDLIFSNFGGFNCLSPKDLEKACSEFSNILKPNGAVLAVIMGKFCWWESLYFLLKNQYKNVSRRWLGKPLSAKLNNQTIVETWYYSPQNLKKMLELNSSSTKVIVDEVIPIGVWLPPSYLNPFFTKRPQILSFLNFLENYSQTSIFAYAADHFLIFSRKI